jgi:hypothetical protein
MTLTVNGTLVAGATANIKTAAVGETVEVKDEDADDIPETIPVRVVTEPGKGGQYDILFYACKSAGTNVALKTKDHGLVDFEFEAFEESTLAKVAQWRTLSTAS